MPASDKFWRNLSVMHVVFALSVFILLVSTIWMTADDHDTQWRDYQRTFDKLVTGQLERDLREIQTPENDVKLEALKSKIDKTERELSPRLTPLRERLDKAQRNANLADERVRAEKAKLEEAKSKYGLAIGQPEKVVGPLLEQMQDIENRVHELSVAARDARIALKTIQDELNAETKTLDEYKKQLAAMQSDAQRIGGALVKVDPASNVLKQGEHEGWLSPGWFSPIKRKVMEWPIIDGFNSHLKIQQDWLPKIKIDYGGMASVARFDRCRSCHLAIDRTVAGGAPAFPFGVPNSQNPSDWVKTNTYPHPFATHPRTDVYLSSTSPHPLPRFGCTVCHDGQGSGTDFSNASHTPNDPHQEHEWEKEHDFYVNHYWEYPMYPQRFLESSCIKCHHSVVELGINPRYGATAPKLYEGYQLIKTYGCFGCHEINGYEGGISIGPDLRLEPTKFDDAELREEDPTFRPGKLRKVGPSLKHVAQKTSENWLAYWIEEPKRFRPTTRMPQFFHLSNQDDELAYRFQPIEIAATARFLIQNSTPIPLIHPAAGYVPNAERGKQVFSEHCLACHQHEDFPEITVTFGPNLTQVHEKLNRDADNPSFSSWLYTWLRDPSGYHPRTRMPNLFLEPYREGENAVDPAADIVAFLLAKGPKDYPPLSVDPRDLDDLVVVLLPKSVTDGLTDEQKRALVANGARYPVSDPSQVRGDEAELAKAPFTPESKMLYVGRKTLSRYGCYGCHDISGFEDARPIGTALQDWGRKDTSRLDFAHIAEYLEHHGESGGLNTRWGASTAIRADEALRRANGHHEFASSEERERELRVAYFYDSLLHHGRPGFFWQKLRDPRSYDYGTLETKRYDERLRMPKFPFNGAQIEEIATFVLGLVAEPPIVEYVYNPGERDRARIQGEELLEKYNCTGCHMVELPEITYVANLDSLTASELLPNEDPNGPKLLVRLKPPRNALTGEILPNGDKVLNFHGLVYALPSPLDAPEDQEYAYDLWETLQVGDKQIWPGSRMLVPATKLKNVNPARGGRFAEWLVDSLMKSTTENNRGLAWQMVPPPLYKEGIKAQTAWLYNFLRNPIKIRHTTVLRMPRFNMTAEEARSLANYFAAVDGASFPYQQISERDRQYLDEKEREFQSKWPGQEDYLMESWKMLNAPLCVKCHSVGGREYSGTNPKTDIQGPNLDLASDRLRPDWLMLWLYKPSWITPYTSMPVPPTIQSLFGGEEHAQRVALRDALVNYHRLMEQIGKMAYEEPGAAGQSGGE